MEQRTPEILSRMLGVSLATAQLPLIIDAAQVAELLRCTKSHVEALAERGRLPATKYGRGWIFVTAQVIQCVLEECAANLSRERDSSQCSDPVPKLNKAEAATSQSPSSSRTSHTSALTLDRSVTLRPRGRPRRQLPEEVTLPHGGAIGLSAGQPRKSASSEPRRLR